MDGRQIRRESTDSHVSSNLLSHFPPSLPVVTDLLMNETISDLALAKVGPHSYLVLDLLCCIVFCIELD